MFTDLLSFVFLKFFQKLVGKPYRFCGRFVCCPYQLQGKEKRSKSPEVYICHISQFLNRVFLKLSQTNEILT